MANAVRKIYTKIGNSHQYLLGTTKTTSYGGQLLSDTVQQHSSESQVENKFKLNYLDNLCRQSQLLYCVGQPVKNKHSTTAAIEWFNKRTYNNNYNPISSLTNLKSTMTKPDISRSEITPCDNNNLKSDPNGLPSAEQLNSMHDKLIDDLPKMFKENLDYSLFHPKLEFENNIKGKSYVGLHYFMTTISILRLMGHIKYAFVKFDILKITKHPEDGTIKVRWRIKGITGMKVFFKFWKFRLWDLEQVIKENIESWHDGFSVFYVKSDGLIHKLTADKMQPDNDPVVEDKNSLATKLALFLGISPQLNSLDCLVTFDSEQTNELFKMIILSMEDVV